MNEKERWNLKKKTCNDKLYYKQVFVKFLPTMTKMLRKKSERNKKKGGTKLEILFFHSKTTKI